MLSRVFLVNILIFLSSFFAINAAPTPFGVEDIGSLAVDVAVPELAVLKALVNPSNIGSFICILHRSKIFLDLHSASSALDDLQDAATQLNNTAMVTAAKQAQRSISNAKDGALTVAEAILLGKPQKVGVSQIQKALNASQSFLVGLNTTEPDVADALSSFQEEVDDAWSLADAAQEQSCSSSN